MKHKTFLFTFLSIAASFATGCNKEKTTAQQVESVKTETKAAAVDMRDYTFARKDEFVKGMQDELDALNKDLDQLEAKIGKSSDTVKAEAEPKLKALRAQAAQFNEQLAEAKNATESTWDNVKATSQKAVDSLKDGFNQARQWVSEKIAP